MAVLSKEEIVAKITTTLGGATSDDAIALVEDVSDTIDELSKGANPDGKDWKAEAERIDKEWREKYVKRFSGKATEDDDIETKGNENKPLTFENLFK